MSENNRKRRRQLAWDLGVVPRYCAAHRKNGDPCRLPPIKGGAVCHKHGGRAPQVVRAARERLGLASEAAVVFLAEVLRDERVPLADRHRAALAILDRAGLGAGVKLEHSGEVRLSFADRLTIVEVMDEFGGDKDAALEVLTDPAALEERDARQREAVVAEDPQLSRVLARAGHSAEPAPLRELPSVAVRRMLERQSTPAEPEVIEAELLPDESYREPDSTPPDAHPGPPNGPRTRQAHIQR